MPSSLRRLAPLATLLLLSAILQGRRAAAESASVDISNFAFQPAALTVSPGTTVTWVNDDSVPHTTTSDGLVWSSPDLAPGDTYSFTFSAPGTYTYHCAIHPFMTAEVVVQAAATATSPAQPTGTSPPAATSTPVPPTSIPKPTPAPHATPATPAALGKPGVVTGPPRGVAPTSTLLPTRTPPRSAPNPGGPATYLPDPVPATSATAPPSAPGTPIPIPLSASLPPFRPAPMIHRV